MTGDGWLTECRNLAFLPEDETRRPGFKLDYQSLTLHALTPASNDLEAHLYCQIDDGQAAGGGDGDGDEDDYGEMRELRVFVGQGQCESPSPLPVLDRTKHTAFSQPDGGCDSMVSMLILTVQCHHCLKLYPTARHFTLH